MARKEATQVEVSKHYGGTAEVKFYPKAHYYAVTDPEMGFVNKRMGGATSLTGLLGKGQGLMLYPMYEMKKFLKNYLRSTTVEEFFDSPMSLEDLLKEGTQAHVRKSDRGKSVGTDAHAWVEDYLKESIRVQEKLGLKSAADIHERRAEYDAEFKMPEILTVDELGLKLRKSYIDIFKAAKPSTIEAYRALSKSLFADADIQEALHIEATMLQKSTTAAKQWFMLHDVFVHGTEDTIYSRKYQICGKYDADLEVRCSSKCGHCYVNGDQDKLASLDNDSVFTGRYMTDFKSTNESTEAPKGIYPEYLAQCGVYDLAKTEEFPEIVYAGYLILNGSKNNGTFNTHYSFERERNKEWARRLALLREDVYQAKKEVQASA